MLLVGSNAPLVASDPSFVCSITSCGQSLLCTLTQLPTCTLARLMSCAVSRFLSCAVARPLSCAVAQPLSRAVARPLSLAVARLLTFCCCFTACHNSQLPRYCDMTSCRYFFFRMLEYLPRCTGPYNH